MTLELAAQAIAVLIGLAVGSFLNVVADRLPRGESLVAPGSHCDGCGRRLAPWEMVPLLSYAGLRGRCRTCGAAIGRRTPLVEVTSAAIALAAWRIYGPSAQAVLAAVFGWLFLTLSVIDAEQHQVPRLLVLGGIALAIVASPWWLAGGVRSALLGAAIGGLPYAMLYIIAGWIYGRGKGVGLGDVWAALLMGLVAGFPGAVVALLAAALSALVIVGVLLGLGVRGRRDAVATVPFLACGAAIGVLWSSGVLTAALRLFGL